MANNATSTVNMVAANLAARNAVLANSIEMIQNLNDGVGTYNPANTTVITLKPIMAGLTKGFYINVSVDIVNLGTNTLYLTEQGISQIFSSIILTDTNSIQRINTDGFHVAMLNAIRFKTPLGSTRSISNSDSDFGSNYNTVSIPSSIATNTALTPAKATFTIYIPLAYAGNDLRGAIYTNVANASMNIQLNINPNAITTATAASAPVRTGAQINSCYANATAVGATGAYVSSITVTGRQVFLNNLPAWSNSYPAQFNQGGTLLPIGDLSVYYQMIKSFPQLNLAAGTKSPIPYAPQRSYLTNLLVYNNGNTLNNGTDLTSINIETANQIPFLQGDPYFLSQLVENDMRFDLPYGTYLINRRHSPINTINYGNMQINVTPSTVNAGAYVIDYNEFFSYAGVTNTAQAIA